MVAEPEPPLAEIVKKSHGSRFEKARRGFSTSQVDVFLSAIASRIQALEKQLNQPRSSDEVVQDPSISNEDVSGSSKRIARLVQVAELEVERLREEADAEAATLRSDAKEEASRITREARDEATREVDDVQAFLDHVDMDTRRISEEADERRRQMDEEIRTMQKRLSSVATALDRVLDPKGS
jgi:cell division septum initiation protein DivIVA